MARRDDELQREIQTHLDLEAEDRVAEGVSENDARYAARRAFGSVARTQEDVRAVWTRRWLENLRHDVRHAIRSFRRTPALVMAAVVTLGLGIGANTAVFSVVDAVLLRPLTYEDAERLVSLHETVPGLGRIPVGAAAFEEWRANAQSIEQMALMAVAPVILTNAGDPERLDAARVSATLFPMLGIEPAIGRTFTADEELPGRHRVVVLSDGLWRRRFGADASVIGRTIVLNGEPYVVAGVLPREFRFPRLEQVFVMNIAGGRPQLWMPFAIGDEERSENSFAALAKLRHGRSAEDAQAELRAIQTERARQFPVPLQLGADVVPLKEQITGPSRDTLALVWAAIAAVLLIACGNVTSLLLARGTARDREFAIRGALGASRGALLRHSLIDSLTLVAIGGAAGVALAYWMLPVLLRLAPADVPRLDEVSLDGRALLFAALAATAAGLLVALLPARRATGTHAIESVNVSARASAVTRHGRATRGLMVSMQAGLTLVCLAAAGLVIQSLLNVLRVEPGFATHQILTVEVGLSPGRYPDRDARAAFAREALQRMQALPGVTDAAVVNRLPLHGISVNDILVVEGTERADIPMQERPLGDIRSVSATYFRTLGIPPVEGELFPDTGITRPVAVLSAAMAERAFPGQRAVGRRFRVDPLLAIRHE